MTDDASCCGVSYPHSLGIRHAASRSVRHETRGGNNQTTTERTGKERQTGLQLQIRQCKEIYTFYLDKYNEKFWIPRPGKRDLVLRIAVEPLSVGIIRNQQTHFHHRPLNQLSRSTTKNTLLRIIISLLKRKIQLQHPNKNRQ